MPGEFAQLHQKDPPELFGTAPIGCDIERGEFRQGVREFPTLLTGDPALSSRSGWVRNVPEAPHRR